MTQAFFFFAPIVGVVLLLSILQLVLWVAKRRNTAKLMRDVEDIAKEPLLKPIPPLVGVVSGEISLNKRIEENTDKLAKYLNEIEKELNECVARFHERDSQDDLDRDIAEQEAVTPGFSNGVDEALERRVEARKAVVPVVAPPKKASRPRAKSKKPKKK